MGSKMEAVAELLGVKIDEEFDIEGHAYNPHRLTYVEMLDCNGTLESRALVKLLRGEYKIVKRPFKPREGEDYWYVGGVGTICSTSNLHETRDYLRISSGNCFRTREEARAHAEEWVQKYKEFFND